MKQTKLNSIILDAFDSIIEDLNPYSSDNSAETKFTHLNLLLCRLEVEEDCYEAIYTEYLAFAVNNMPTITQYDIAQKKLLFISLLAIMDDTELKEIFGISPKLPQE